MTTYHRVRYDGRTIYLRDMQTLRHTIRGREVDRDGDRLDRYHIIARHLVTRTTPMTIDLHYATLIPTDLGGTT